MSEKPSEVLDFSNHSFPIFMEPLRRIYFSIFSTTSRASCLHINLLLIKENLTDVGPIFNLREKAFLLKWQSVTLYYLKDLVSKMVQNIQIYDSVNLISNFWVLTEVHVREVVRTCVMGFLDTQRTNISSLLYLKYPQFFQAYLLYLRFCVKTSRYFSESLLKFSKLFFTEMVFQEPV